MADKPKINKEILKWARTSARISQEKVAKTISRKYTADRIREWEDPESKESPSMAQLKKLARLYRRPLEAFSLPWIPKEFPKLKDFRSNKDELSTAAIFIMREIQEKQEWLSDFFRKSKKGKLPFAGRYNIKHDAAVVAADIRKTLGISRKDNPDKPLKYWISKAEEQRIFIALSSNFHTRLKLDSDVFKGFVIADAFAPFIFINSDDWDQGQLFTLVHELAHIWIGVSGISADTGLVAPTPGLHAVEKFCNEVAVLALLPETDVRTFLPDKGVTEFRHIAKAARRMGVYGRTIVLRLKSLGLATEESGELLKSADNAWKDFLDKEARKPKSSGGPNYYVMVLRRNSRSFATVIMDNFKRGRISGGDASRLLNVKEANFGKLETYVYK